MTTPLVLLLQALTNLSLAPPGPGLPGGWQVERVAGAAPPSFAVTAAHTLRIETSGTRGAAGFARYRLRAPLRPQGGGPLWWQWRTSTPLRAAALRRRTTDAAPARVAVGFADGRTLLYTWGNTEGRGEHFVTSSGRGVLVLERADDADGSWHMERRDPFADYRLVFDRAPPAIVAVGVGGDTNPQTGRAVAEVGELTWGDTAP